MLIKKVRKYVVMPSLEENYSVMYHGRKLSLEEYLCVKERECLNCNK